MKVREIEKLLNEALEASKMENVSFTFNPKDTEHIVETTKLYRETWIIWKIRRAIELLEEGSTGKKLKGGRAFN